MDKRQLWRLFVDGRFQKKYNGWVGYEGGERGSVKAVLNGFGHMIDHFDISSGLRATYLRELHKICMLSVETSNLKSSPGDIRYLNSGMPFFAKSTTYEHLVEVFALRKGDGTALFNNRRFEKAADELSVDEVYDYMVKEGSINYRNWYPNLDLSQQEAIAGKRSLHEFYSAKHTVQMLIVQKMEEIVERYNRDIVKADSDKEKLRVIALVPRELELLHPFPDGNSRTFSCVTLTHLLLFNGFPPALLDNPNLDNEVSLEQWVGEIERGMERTRWLLKNNETELFGYSIVDMKRRDRETFLMMASDLGDKIDGFREIFLTPQRLVEYCGGRWLDPVSEQLRFTGVGTYGTYHPGNIYFAMALKEWAKEGKDLGKEVARVLSRGMRAAVIDDVRHKPLFDIPCLLVEDTFQAFKQCAIAVRRERDPFTVLITGTEGKTGAKVQFHHLLNQQVKAHGVLNSANTEVPVLRSLINLAEEDEIELNEVSVGSDEAYRVERAVMVSPNLCFFTNIGPNHMDMHKTLDNIMTAKSSVVEGLREGGKCIVNSSIEHYPKLLNAIFKRRPGTEILNYGHLQGDNARLLGQKFNPDRFGWEVEADVDGVRLDYFVPLIQSHAPLASVGTLLAIKEMGYDVEQAARDYASLQPFETMGRILTIKKRSGDVWFYDQSRRGGMHGMRSAFSDLANFRVKGRIVALVGGVSIKKDSRWTQESHHELAQLINSSAIDRLYTTGQFMDYVTDNLEKKEIFVAHNEDIDQLATLLFNEIRGGDLLFIIGSAYLYLGRVSDRLLKMRDRGRFDPDILDQDLSREESDRYRYLVVKDEVGAGVDLELSLHQNRLDQKVYTALEAGYESYLAARGDLLFHFFKELSQEITSNPRFSDISSEVAKGGERYLITEEKAVIWFNNLDEVKGYPKEQLFGLFFDFGDDRYLLHIEVATQNLHAGFVQYERQDGHPVPVKMAKAEGELFLQRYGENLRRAGIRLQKRKWGLAWLTVDYGTFIRVTQSETFMTMLRPAQSRLYRRLLLPMMTAVTPE
ncbi:MAG: Fic family protein [Gammaproteobacteria bacterium]|nr:Fic family protein [Gammaproteobacteria bacterium]